MTDCCSHVKGKIKPPHDFTTNCDAAKTVVFPLNNMTCNTSVYSCNIYLLSKTPMMRVQESKSKLKSVTAFLIGTQKRELKGY